MDPVTELFMPLILGVLSSVLYAAMISSSKGLQKCFFAENDVSNYLKIKKGVFEEVVNRQITSKELSNIGGLDLLKDFFNFAQTVDIIKRLYLFNINGFENKTDLEKEFQKLFIRHFRVKNDNDAISSFSIKLFYVFDECCQKSLELDVKETESLLAHESLSKRRHRELSESVQEVNGNVQEVNGNIREVDEKLNSLIAKFNDLAQKNSSHYTKPTFELRLPVTRFFTGRSAELNKLKKAFFRNKNNNNICVITGPSGFGKSVLASHFASLNVDKFPDGVVGLKVDGKDANTIVRDFARIYGVKVDSNDERDATLLMKELFAQRKALIIFDNVENKEINLLLNPGKNCAIILTTHDQLLPTLLEIPPDCIIDLSPLPDTASLELLKSMIGRERIDKDPKSALNIIKLVGNMPLALKIIGASLRMRSMRSLYSFERSLNEEKTRLAKLKIVGDKDLNVQASISLSLKYLKDDDTRRFFACISVCATDGFSIYAAIAASGCDESRASDHLFDLLRFCLLEEQSDSEKYVMHPLTLLYSRDLARQLGILNDAAERHARFYINYLKNDKDVYNELYVLENIDDILLAANWMSNQDVYDSQFLLRLFLIFNNIGRWKQAVDLISNLLPKAEALSNWSDVVQLRVQQANYLLMSGEMTKAEEALTPIPPILEKVQDQMIHQRLEIAYFNILGTVFKKQGHLTKAEEMIRRSWKIAEKLEYITSQSIALSSLGDFRFREFWDIAENLDDKKFQSIVLNSLGCILRDQGRLEEAEEQLRKCWEITKKLDDIKQESIVLNSFGSVLRRQGRLEEAEKQLRKCWEITEKLDDKKAQSIALNSLGSILSRQGRLEEAEEQLRKCWEITEKLDDKKAQSIVLNSLGSLLKRQGRLKEAEEQLRKCWDIAEKLDDKKAQSIALNSLGSVLRNQGKLEEAEKELRKCWKITENFDDKRSQSIVLNSLRVVFEDQEKWEEAEKVLRKSWDIAKKMDDRTSESRVINNLRNVLLKQGKLEEAEGINRKINSRVEKIKGGSVFKKGTVTKLIKHPIGYMYGFICPDKGKENIYFREEFIEPECLHNLKVSSRVEFGERRGPKGPQATYIRLVQEINRNRR